jgi:HD-GYP domain-containing protein (c-di-GMP phosphodiesterase class II)
MTATTTAKTDNQEISYRPINLSMITGTGNKAFDIYYKTDAFGTIKYVKFASSSPEHLHKITKIVDEGETEEEFYISDDDLFIYYEEATQSLRKMVSDPNIPFEKKSKKIYNVSKDIMQEFFDNNASNKILHSSESVMEIMDECLSSSEVGFYGIAKITNKDYYTYTHSVNVGLYCMTYGIKSHMSPNDIKDLGLGGMLHDVGKSKIDAELLNKKGRLTGPEFQEIKKHTVYGEEILTSMQCYGNSVIGMASSHHEQYDGKGYPKGLAKDEIELNARICKVMDVYDALTTKRSYKKAMPPIEALFLMKKEMGPHFDPGIVENFILLMGPGS